MSFVESWTEAEVSKRKRIKYLSCPVCAELERKVVYKIGNQSDLEVVISAHKLFFHGLKR